MADFEPNKAVAPLPKGAETVHVSERPFRRAFTFFSLPFDRDSRSSYWKQVIEQNDYLSGILMTDRTFRWSFDTPVHSALQDELTSTGQRPDIDDDLVRIQIRTSPMRELPYEASIRGWDTAAIDDVITYLENNLGNLPEKMLLMLGTMQRGRQDTYDEQFKGRFSDYLQMRKAH